MKVSWSRWMGAVSLVAGTTIGAGMLAMPATTAFAGIAPTLVCLSFAWLFMLSTSWMLLDATLYVGNGANLLSIAEILLGKWAKRCCSVFYLLLLYALTSAYISGASITISLFYEKISGRPANLSSIAFFLVLAFSRLLYYGISSVDSINRVLTMALFFSYILLIAFLPMHIDPALYAHRDVSALFFALPVMITSFGFHIVIPSLSTYLHYERRSLRNAIFLGSFLAFVIYAIWIILLLGVLPLSGPEGLERALKDGGSVTSILMKKVPHVATKLGSVLFSFFAILTSFLGVSLSLSDFLLDGLRKYEGKCQKIFNLFLTFFPPFLFVLYYPKGFLLALDHAAIFVLLLLAIFPILLVRALPKTYGYRSFFRRAYLFVLFALSCFIIVVSALQYHTFFPMISKKYF